jgi:hypothetical protein
MRFVSYQNDFAAMETEGRQFSAALILARFVLPNGLTRGRIEYGLIVQTERCEFRVFFN